MLCLGNESTAHTYSLAIVDSSGKIIAEVRDMYQTEQGGMIPNEVAKHHKKVQNSLLKNLLKQAKLTLKDIDLISIASGPGLAPALLAGMKQAKQLSKENNIQLVGVNHICAHLEIGKLLTKAKDPVFVFTSGANTQIIALEGGKYRIFGETLDTGIGNALDKFGREAKLGFPAGPKIEELAKKGKYIELPYSVKGMDVCFSGIITKALQLLEKGAKVEDLCFSLQETLFAMVTEVTERALAHTDKTEALLIGGVAANQRFCEMLSIMCKERKANFYAAPLKYAGDNGVNIAWQGILEKNKATKDLKTIDIKPRWRVDQIEVDWV